MVSILPVEFVGLHMLGKCGVGRVVLFASSLLVRWEVGKIDRLVSSCFVCGGRGGWAGLHLNGHSKGTSFSWFGHHIFCSTCGPWENGVVCGRSSQLSYQAYTCLACLGWDEWAGLHFLLLWPCLLLLVSQSSCQESTCLASLGWGEWVGLHTSWVGWGEWPSLHMAFFCSAGC